MPYATMQQAYDMQAATCPLSAHRFFLTQVLQPHDNRVVNCSSSAAASSRPLTICDLACKPSHYKPSPAIATARAAASNSMPSRRYYMPDTRASTHLLQADVASCCCYCHALQASCAHASSLIHTAQLLLSMAPVHAARSSMLQIYNRCCATCNSTTTAAFACIAVATSHDGMFPVCPYWQPVASNTWLLRSTTVNCTMLCPHSSHLLPEPVIVDILQACCSVWLAICCCCPLLQLLQLLV
jgi:hypothetical protein